MVPNVKLLMEEITETQYPSKTHKINVIEDTSDDEKLNYDKISGYIDDLEAVKQAVYKILNTERYKYVIYSWDYGVELVDLIGKPIPYVMAEVSRRVTEALTMDDRIDDVVDFEFETKGKTLHTTFTVVTTYGNIETDLEVAI